MKSRTLSVILAIILAGLAVGLGWFYYIKNGHVPPNIIPPKPAAGIAEPPSPEPEPASDEHEQSTQGGDSLTPAQDESPEPSPAVEPTPEPEPEPAPLPSLTGSKGAQNLADLITRASSGDAGSDGQESAEELITRLEEQGILSPEQAAALRAWSKVNKSTGVESVGTVTQDGKKISRFRIKGDQGEDLLLDLEEPSDKDGSWRVAKITPMQHDVDGKHALDLSDSLQVAEAFINALKEGDMFKARSYVTGKQVSDVTVAGLCMIFAEGGYRLRDQRPIRSSFENELAAAYLIYLQADGGKVQANVGVEMKKSPEAAWLVSAVALDSLLSSYEKTADEEGGRYFPLVKNPQGGDSFALFFAFDDSALTPRSLRQLKIVAELLKEKDRKLDISGHTDDVGLEGYNEKLSLRRAEAVKEALISFGVLPEQVSTKGMGMRQPRRSYVAKDEDTSTMDEDEMEHLRAENRRAEIYLDFK